MSVCFHINDQTQDLKDSLSSDEYSSGEIKETMERTKQEYFLRASLMAQLVKNPPAMQETWIRSLGWQDPLEKGMATHFSILVWRIPMNRGAWQAIVHGVAKSPTRLSDWTELNSFIYLVYGCAGSSLLCKGFL